MLQVQRARRLRRSFISADAAPHRGEDDVVPITLSARNGPFDYALISRSPQIYGEAGGNPPRAPKIPRNICRVSLGGHRPGAYAPPRIISLSRVYPSNIARVALRNCPVIEKGSDSAMDHDLPFFSLIFIMESDRRVRFIFFAFVKKKLLDRQFNL